MQHQIFLVFQLMFVKLKYLDSKERQKMFLQKLITSLNMHTFQRGSQTWNVDIALMYDDTDLSAIVFEKKSKTMNLFCFVVCKNNWMETFF